MFISSEKELFSWTYLLLNTPRRTKMLICPVWNKILKIWGSLFDLTQIEDNEVNIVSKFFYHKNVELLEKHRKRTAKATPKIGKTYILHIYREYLFCLQSNTSDSFLQTCINFVEQRLEFSHFEDSMIPQNFWKEL